MEQRRQEEATFFDVPEKLHQGAGEQFHQGKSQVEHSGAVHAPPQGENVAAGEQSVRTSDRSNAIQERPRHVSFTSGVRVEEIAQPVDSKHVGFFDAPDELSAGETGEASTSSQHEAETDTGGEAEVDRPQLTLEAQQKVEEKIVEIFDPYYGIGLDPGRPDYPLQLVFALMDSQRFKSSAAATKLYGIAKKVGGLVGLAMCIYYFAFLDYHVRVHPRPPHLTVHYWNWQGCGVFPVTNDSIIRQQEEGMGNYYAYRLNCGFKLFLNITNPNGKLDLHYDSIEATVLYAARPICYDKIDRLFHPSASTIRPFFYLFTVGLPVPLNLGYELGPKLERGMFYEIEETIVFVVEIHSRFTLKGSHLVHSLAYRIRWRCEFTITTMSGRDTSQCWPLEGNTRPSHGGLKLYRTAAWPTTYTSLSFPMPSIPEYYDPAYNYARR